jgi:23S rRNA pseudouridine1911/1915/1917 synthase
VLRVLYQDNHLLVVVKEPGVLSQSDRPDGTDDLLSQAKAYIKKKFNKPGAVWLGLVHRLDREVGGVMVFARTSKAAARLSEEIRAGRTRKVYRALLEAKPRPGPGDARISESRDADQNPKAAGEGRSAGDWIQLQDWLSKDTNRRMAVAAHPPPASEGPRQPDSATAGAESAAGKLARLRYRILPTSPIAKSLLAEIELETGRFHQIRYQFASRGAPILGDRKYGSRRSVPGVKLALHCVEMGIRHPVRGEFMSFTCEPPASWSPKVSRS